MNTIELIKEYKKNVCSKCNKEGDCNIHITIDNKQARCLEYKQAEYCMKNQCNNCRNYNRCFGGEEDG